MTSTDACFFFKWIYMYDQGSTALDIFYTKKNM